MSKQEKTGFFGNLFSHLKSVLLTGVLLLTPSALTLWVLFKLFSFADSVINVLPIQWQPKTVIGFDIPGLGIFLSLILIYLAGFGVRYYIGRSLVEFTERILVQVPIVSGLYQAIKQVMSTMFSHSSDHFREVVLIEYPRRDMYCFAFLTNKKDYLTINDEKTLISIFLPSTPNPTTGFYLLLPSSDIWSVDISVEEAFKIIMSAGIVTPEIQKSAKPFYAPSNPIEAKETKESSPIIK